MIFFFAKKAKRFVIQKQNGRLMKCVIRTIKINYGLSPTTIGMGITVNKGYIMSNMFNELC